MHIFIDRNLEEGKLSVAVKTTDSIDSVIGKVSKLTGIPKEQQGLLFAGEVLENDKPLQNYGIKQGSTLLLQTSMKIFVKPKTGQRIVVEVFPSESLYSLKIKLRNWYDIPTDQISLNFQGSQLDSDEKSMTEIGICDSSKLRLKIDDSGDWEKVDHFEKKDHRLDNLTDRLYQLKKQQADVQDRLGERMKRTDDVNKQLNNLYERRKKLEEKIGKLAKEKTNEYLELRLKGQLESLQSKTEAAVKRKEKLAVEKTNLEKRYDKLSERIQKTTEQIEAQEQRLAKYENKD